MRFLRCLKVLKNVYGVQLAPMKSTRIRKLHSTAIRHTDGVYNALTEMRVRTPWIEALRKQREDNGNGKDKSNIRVTPPGRDLTPKKMCDSYHRVVSTFSSSNLSA